MTYDIIKTVINYDLIPQECANLPVALKSAGFPIDSISEAAVRIRIVARPQNNAAVRVVRLYFVLHKWSRNLHFESKRVHDTEEKSNSGFNRV